MSNRYRVPPNQDFEPGSNNEVLTNFLAIKSQEEIEALEEEELQRAELELITIFGEDHIFTAEDIKDIHELWLGDIYPFAGHYRTVTMSKDGFPFASPTQIPNLMKELDKLLSVHTPCHFTDIDQLAYALGIIHVELILIHPFREGNGRTARLLADLMSIQSKQLPIDFQHIDQTQNKKGFREYILAIHAGLDKNYKPITDIFKDLLLTNHT